MRSPIALGVALLLVGCEAVPALTFTDGAAPEPDGGGDAGGDSEALEAGDGSSDAPQDAVEQNSCPTVTPPATLCCSGNSPCVGCSSNGDCQKCSCNANQVCCFKPPGTVSCAPFGTACP